MINVKEIRGTTQYGKLRKFLCWEKYPIMITDKEQFLSSLGKGLRHLKGAKVSNSSKLRNLEEFIKEEKLQTERMMITTQNQETFLQVTFEAFSESEEDLKVIIALI